MEEDTIFNRVEGLKLIDQTTAAYLTATLDQSAREIIEAVEERELLSATSIYREMEEIQHRQKRS